MGKQIYSLKLSQDDVELLLFILGREINIRKDQGESSRMAEFLVDRIYRMLGVRLDG